MDSCPEFLWPQAQRHVPTGVYCGQSAIRRLAERRKLGRPPGQGASPADRHTPTAVE